MSMSSSSSPLYRAAASSTSDEHCEVKSTALWVLVGIVVAVILGLAIWGIVALATRTSSSSSQGKLEEVFVAPVPEGVAVVDQVPVETAVLESQPYPVQVQATEIFKDVSTHPGLQQCYTTTSYDPNQELAKESDAFVPPHQKRLRDLPAVRRLNMNQETPATAIGANIRQGIDTVTSSSFDATHRGDDESLYARTKQTEGVSLAGIYSKDNTKGISLIHQKSRMTDPTKLIPHAQPGQESQRMVQAGPSIADIGCRVPKITDVMKMMRGGGSVLSHQIPLDKPPLYTEGLNACRPTRLPAKTAEGTQLFGLNPYEVSDVIGLGTPNPFISAGIRASTTSYPYVVP